jgi:hypothetical protein
MSTQDVRPWSSVARKKERSELTDQLNSYEWASHHPRPAVIASAALGRTGTSPPASVQSCDNIVLRRAHVPRDLRDGR